MLKANNKVIPEINNNHKNIKQILIIQKYIRGYLTRKYILIPSSFYQTKDWRKNRNWYKNGKSNECEKYQINLIERISLTPFIRMIGFEMFFTNLINSFNIYHKVIKYIYYYKFKFRIILKISLKYIILLIPS